MAHSLEEAARHFNDSISKIEETIARAKTKLCAVRAKRPRPHLDDKILVDWNGLMISSLAFASRVLNDEHYAQAATKATNFILKKLKNNKGRLLHRYREGEAAILGTLDDYAFFIHGLLDLYEATFAVEYLQEAKRLTDEMIHLFWDEQGEGFFFTAEDSEELLFKQKEIYDGAIPSGNSLALLDLERLAHITLEENLTTKVEILLKTFASEVANRPSAYTQFLIGLDFVLGPSAEIVLAEGKEPETLNKLIQDIYQRFLPNKVVIRRPLGGKELNLLVSVVPFIKEQEPQAGKTTAYVCQNHICQRPVTSLEQFTPLLK